MMVFMGFWSHDPLLLSLGVEECCLFVFLLTVSFFFFNHFMVTLPSCRQFSAWMEMAAKFGVDQWQLKKIQILIHPLLVIPVINGMQQILQFCLYFFSTISSSSSWDLNDHGLPWIWSWAWSYLVCPSEAWCSAFISILY